MAGRSLPKIQARANHHERPWEDTAPHPEVGLLMSLALDDMLEPSERAHLDAHLAQCPLCRAYWQLWQSLDRELRAAPMAEPPPHLVARTATRLLRREGRRRLRLLLGLGSLALLVWLVGLLGMAGLTGLLVALRWEQIADTLRWLATVWAGMSVVMGAAWRILAEWFGHPQGVVFVLGYSLLALLVLWGWGRMLRRSTRPVE